MAIDIGSAAIDRGSSASPFQMYLSLNNPANESGALTSIEIWCASNISAGLKVGTFYGSGTSWTCRDYATLGAITAGSKQTFEVNIAVEAGDIIGIYSPSTGVEMDTSGGGGLLYNGGEDWFDSNPHNYSSIGGWDFSVYGIGATIEPATVITQSPTAIEKTTCTANGEITATGGANPTIRGFCYKEGTTGDPNIDDDTVVHEDGDFGVEAYDLPITGLSANTSYRIRSYAVNSAGTSYGDTVGFETDISASYVEIYTTDESLVPMVDDTIWLGQVASPFKAIKGLIIKDTTNGKHYKITVISGVVTATALD